MALLPVVLVAIVLEGQQVSTSPTAVQALPARTPTPLCKTFAKPVLIHRVEPEYPSEEQKQRLEGVVILESVIATDGSVQKSRVLQSPSEGLSKAALAAVRQWRYEPAVCDGKVVWVYVTHKLTFELKK